MGDVRRLDANDPASFFRDEDYHPAMKAMVVEFLGSGKVYPTYERIWGSGDTKITQVFRKSGIDLVEEFEVWLWKEIGFYGPKPVHGRVTANLVCDFSLWINAVTGNL